MKELFESSYLSVMSEENDKLRKEIERLKEQLNDEIDDELKQSEIMVKKQEEIERLNNIINRTTKYVESLSSSGRGCDIYEDIKQEILKELKGRDKE